VVTAAGGGKMRRRNSLASFNRVLDSQSQSSRDEEEADNVIPSGPSSFSQSETELANTSGVKANGSVPHTAGTDNKAFDVGAETAAENQPELVDQTTQEHQGVKTVTAEINSRPTLGALADRARGKHPLAKRVSFFDSNDEPENDKDENSTKQQ